MKKLLRATALVVLLLLPLLASVQASAFCEETFDTFCDMQCDQSLLCGDPSSRCCWQSGTGSSCGDANTCWECDCLSFGLF